MCMQVKDQERNSIDDASVHLLDALKNLFSELFAASSQDKALNLLQHSKGFDPLKNPQSLVIPKALQKERLLDKRLPVRKAA